LGPRVLFFSGGTALRETSQVLTDYTRNSFHLWGPGRLDGQVDHQHGADGPVLERPNGTSIRRGDLGRRARACDRDNDLSRRFKIFRVGASAPPQAAATRAADARARFSPLQCLCHRHALRTGGSMTTSEVSPDVPRIESA